MEGQSAKIRSGTLEKSGDEAVFHDVRQKFQPGAQLETCYLRKGIGSEKK